jgi:glycosyltransferase involved in cell wall biosynthesis
MQVPILIGVDGEARSIIERYPAGIFFEPENESDFSEKLHRLITDKAFYEKCKAGAAVLSTDFDRRILACKMLDAIMN